MWVHTGEMGVVQTSKVHWKGASCPRHAGNGHLLNPEKEQGAHDQTPRAGLKKPPGVEVIEVVDEEKAKEVAEVKVWKCWIVKALRCASAPNHLSRGIT